MMFTIKPLVRAILGERIEPAVNYVFAAESGDALNFGEALHSWRSASRIIKGRTMGSSTKYIFATGSRNPFKADLTGRRFSVTREISPDGKTFSVYEDGVFIAQLPVLDDEQLRALDRRYGVPYGTHTSPIRE